MDERPSRVGAALATLAAVVAVVPLAGSPLGLPVGVGGAAALGAGVLRGRRALVSLGAAGLFGGVVAAGIGGLAPEPLLFAMAALVVAWDVGENAVGLGAQLGRAATTARAELVHAAGSVAVAGAGAGLSYGAFRVVGGRQPVAALVLLLFGGVVLASALRG